MLKRKIKGTHLCFSKVVIQIYCTFKIEKFVSVKNFVIFSFCNYVRLGAHVPNISGTVFFEATISSVTQISTT